MSRQASQAGECWSAPILCAGISPLCPPHPCGCALLRGSEAPPSATCSLHPRRGFLVCGKLSSFTAPSHWCSPVPNLLSLFFLFSFALPRYVGSFLPFGKLRSSVSTHLVFCRSCSTCRCISDVFVGRKVISKSYSSTILKISTVGFYSNVHIPIFFQ